MQLANRIGVSRTPLPEALRLLQREGLVDAGHNGRVRIAAMSVDDLQELYALRITVEAIAIRVSVIGDDVVMVGRSHVRSPTVIDRREDKASDRHSAPAAMQDGSRQTEGGVDKR